MGALVQNFNPEMSATEYVGADIDVETSATFEDIENRREELRATVMSAVEKRSRDSEDEEESPPSSITTNNGAITTGKDLLLFLTQKGEESLSEDTIRKTQNQANITSTLYTLGISLLNTCMYFLTDPNFN